VTAKNIVIATGGRPSAANIPGHGLGCNTTIMVRSIFLRGFDQQLANKVG